jgi:hypothetical protein
MYRAKRRSRLLAVTYPRLLTPCGVCSDDPRQLILSTFHDEGAFDRLETRVCRSHGHTVGLTYAARNKATVSPAVMRIRQEQRRRPNDSLKICTINAKLGIYSA